MYTQIRLVLYLVSALVIGGGIWWVYGSIWDRGYAAREAELVALTAERQQELDERARAAAVFAARFTAETSERQRRALEIEDEIRSDTSRNSRSISPDSLRRLETRWGSGPENQ